VVARERYAAGIFAEQRFDSRLHLLDDGFQHRQLARDFDIVLVTPDDVQDCLLPAGRLRESLSALSRADAVVLPAGAPGETLPLAGQQVWHLRRGIQVDHPPLQPVAFCGIARPGRFFSQLREAGIELAKEITFPDHHVYTHRDISELQRLRQNAGGGGFVTTEKDAVKLDTLLSELEPVAVTRVIMELVDAQAAIGGMLAKIERRNWA
jgi:tetraacyldisaccharide 4'-kinase